MPAQASIYFQHIVLLFKSETYTNWKRFIISRIAIYILAPENSSSRVLACFQALPMCLKSSV